MEGTLDNSVKLENGSNEHNTTEKVPFKKTEMEVNVQYGSVENDKHPLIDEPKPNRWHKYISFLKSMTIEPVMFSFMFAYVLNMSCITNMMMDKACLYYYNYSEIICNNLSNYPTEKTNVETIANSYSSYNNALTLLAAVTMIFLAPWSDKYSRKIPLYLAFTGLLAYSVGLIVCTVKFESEIFYLLVARIPGELFGGFICILTIIFSLASEVSTPELRTFKYSLIEIGMGLGMALGGFAGGTILRYYGYLYVFCTGAVLQAFGLLWTFLFVPETTGKDSTATWKEKLCDLFTYENLTRGVKATLRKRENKGRMIILLLFASITVVVLSYESFAGIGFVYAHHIYNWDPMSFQSVNTIFSLSQMGVMIITVPLLTRIYKVPDYILGIIGTLSMMAKNFFIAFAQYSVGFYYLGYVLGFMNPFATLVIRTGISKLVDKDELGRVFSFLATFESIIPMFGTLIITKIFNETIDIVPNVAYMMTVGFFVIPLGTFLFAYLEQRKINKSSSIKTVN